MPERPRALQRRVSLNGRHDGPLFLNRLAHDMLRRKDDGDKVYLEDGPFDGDVRVAALGDLVGACFPRRW